MRLLVLALAATILPTASVAPAQQSGPVQSSIDPQSPLAAKPLADANAEQKCRRADYQRADNAGRTEFRRLDQLPGATAYMAVYRTVNGCEEPMTVTEYRTNRR